MDSDFDRPSMLNRLFYPRPEVGPAEGPGEEWRIPVADGVELGARYFPAQGEGATILFFHGNGEIAADYADVGPLIAQRVARFLVVDYRGYGRSGGGPTVSALLEDAHRVLDAVQERLCKRGAAGPLVVMGRSLGSAPAVELAAARGEEVAGLVVESGFARVKPLLRTLGVREAELKMLHGIELENVEKIRRYRGPTLVIHGAQDHLIPVGDGQALYEASPASYKDLLVVPRADHNSLFFHGLEPYLQALGRLVRECGSSSRGKQPIR